MAAFSAFSWQHILEHVTMRWISEVRSGVLRLLHQTPATSSGPSCRFFDEELNKTVSTFLEKYALLIWPIEQEKRIHLASARIVRDGRDIFATPGNMVITHKKEAELRKCNVALRRNSSAESHLGGKVRTYLIQLLISDELISIRRSIKPMKLLQSFLAMAPSPINSNGKRNGTPVSGFGDNDIHTMDSWRPESEPTCKRRRAHETVTPPTRVSQERSTGYVRLRFTYSGSRRLQRILFCPSRPPAVLPRIVRKAEEPTDPDSVYVKTESPTTQQRPSAAGEYQCWLQSCSESFKAIGDVVDHVQQQHSEIMKAAVPSMERAIAAFLGGM